jgi:hypothetical protein
MPVTGIFESPELHYLSGRLGGDVFKGIYTDPAFFINY